MANNNNSDIQRAHERWISNGKPLSYRLFVLTAENGLARFMCY